MTSVATADRVTESQAGFVKAMTLTDATMLVAGSMIGSGIFIVSADIARSVISPFWLIMAWVVTGVITLLGALAYGELAAMYLGRADIRLPCAIRWVHSWIPLWVDSFQIVIQTGRSQPSRSRSADFSGCVAAIDPDRFGWVPAERHLCFLAGSLMRPRSDSTWPQRPAVDCAFVGRCSRGSTLRGVAEGKIIQTTLTLGKRGRSRFSFSSASTIGRERDGDRRQLRLRPVRG